MDSSDAEYTGASNSGEEMDEPGSPDAEELEPKDKRKRSKKKKRVRRTASEIERNWKCEMCNKSYGSEGALKTHTKLKHPGATVKSSHTTPFAKFLNFNHPANGVMAGVGASTVPDIPFPTSFNPHAKASISTSGIGSSLAFNQIPDSPRTSAFYGGYPKAPSPRGDIGGRASVHGALSEPQSPYGQSFKSSRDPLTDPSLGPPLTPGGPQLANVPADLDPEIIKHTVFVPILVLKIGAFTKNSISCGDVVADFSFAEGRLYWEIFSAPSLYRIEVAFDDINGLGVENQEDGTSLIIFRLSKPPKFWYGVISATHQTKWSSIPDFTNGEASKFRHHVLQLVKSALQDPLLRLLAENERLRTLVSKGLEHEESLLFSGENPDEVASPSSSASGDGDAMIYSNYGNGEFSSAPSAL